MFFLLGVFCFCFFFVLFFWVGGFVCLISCMFVFVLWVCFNVLKWRNKIATTINLSLTTNSSRLIIGI